jgi:phenylacetate-CoA ligase
VILRPEVETLPREALAALQLARLRDRVRWARDRVPLHRGRLAEAGVGPDDLREPAAVARLPFTRKSDFREQYPFGLFAVPREEIVRLHASSGTRGKPTLVGYTRGDLAAWREVMARSLAAAGAEPGHRLQVAYGYGLFTGGLGFHDGAEALGLSVIPASSGNTLRQILLLQDLRPEGLACTPSFALHIADTLAEQGIDARGLGLRYGLFGAEPWTEAMRAAIEARLGLRAVDFYGLSELMGPGVAVECAEVRDGLHVQEDHFLAEVVDAAGRPLPPGDEGELVLTALTKEAVPAIRYRTGDLTRLDPAPCRCGRTTARLARIRARTDDMIVVKGVNVYPSQVEAALLPLPDVAPHYQLVVDRTAGFPRLEVHVEVAESAAARWGGFAPDHPEVGRLRQRVTDRLRALLALAPAVVIGAPRSLPRSEGKAVRVVER